MAMQNVGVKQIEKLVRSTVRDELMQFFLDPDFGLEIRPSAAKRLKRALRQKAAGKVISLEQLRKEFWIS